VGKGHGVGLTFNVIFARLFGKYFGTQTVFAGMRDMNIVEGIE
jgi:hypothetical protein